MQARSLRFAGMVLIILLAGCMGGSAPKTESPSPTAPADAGAVEGQVVDDEVRTVEGATVGLTENTAIRTLTDSAGEFRLEGVPPGTHKLLVQKEGFKPGSLDVQVLAGETTPAKIILTAIPVAVSRPVSFVYEGYLGFDLAIPSGNQFGPGPAGELQRSVYYNVEQPNLVGAYSGLLWNGNVPTLSDRMYLLIYLNLDRTQQCDDAARTYCLPMAWAEGRSPLANGSDDYQENIRDRKDLRINVRFKMRPCTTADVGPGWVNPNRCPNPIDLVKFAVDQRATAYTTLFYGDPAPAGYSPLPPA